MTTVELSPAEADSFDYLIVGGGTAGCVIASRLAEYLPHKRILLIEAGPSDYMDDRVLLLKDWLSLLGSELDYDYATTEQPNGNSHIRHSRAKVLGGCSSHNTLISFRPLAYDCAVWESNGCTGWSFSTFMRLIDKLRNTIQPIHSRHRNQLCKDWVTSCSKALSIPVVHDFNAEIKSSGTLPSCVGFFSVAYNPDDGRRSSASVAYIHPILNGSESRANLKILTNAWVSRVNVSSNTTSQTNSVTCATCTGVSLTLKSGQTLTLTAKSETILCAGAIDTPRLLLLSGLGPRSELEPLGIRVVVDIAGVGANLVDHPETVILWELKQPVPPNCTTMDSDAGIFLRREPLDSTTLPHDNAPDVMMHCYQIPFCLNTSRLGYDVPINAFCMTPNVPRPRSRGRLYLTSADPAVKPALDFRYFTDDDGYDAQTLVYGIRAARRIARTPPFSAWLLREVAPGDHLRSDAELDEYARRAAHTVYHPAGTTRMGDLAADETAVVDPLLRLRHVARIRVADAGVLPNLPTVNPMVTILAVAERAAELIAAAAGWHEQ